MTSALILEVVMGEEDAQPEFVHVEALGEGKGFAHQAADALPGGAEEALGVRSLAACLGAEPVSAPRKRSLIGKPLVAARGGAAEVIRRQRAAQPAGALPENDLRAYRPPPAVCAGKERSRASTPPPPCCQQSSRAHRTPARRLSWRAAMFRAGAADLPPFFPTQRRNVR